MLLQKTDKRRCSLGINLILTTTWPGLLYRCLNSVYPIADQIVVVADEKTPGINLSTCQDFGADLYTAPWPHDFAEQRNRALDRTWTEYVLWIDSDEWVDPWSVPKIDNLMVRPGGLGYYLWSYSPTLQGSHIFVPQLRLFPRLPGVFWEIPIHEQILISMRRLGIRTQMTFLRINHAGYTLETDVMRKHKRNLPMLKKRLRESPEDSFTRGNYEKAVAYERAR